MLYINIYYIVIVIVKTNTFPKRVSSRAAMYYNGLCDFEWKGRLRAYVSFEMTQKGGHNLLIPGWIEKYEKVYNARFKIFLRNVLQNSLPSALVSSSFLTFDFWASLLFCLLKVKLKDLMPFFFGFVFFDGDEALFSSLFSADSVDAGSWTKILLF